MVSVKSLPYTLIGLDIKDVILDLPGLYTYNQDIQDQQAVEHILQSHNIPVLVDLAGVGENLQEHLFTGVQFKLRPGVETFGAS